MAKEEEQKLELKEQLTDMLEQARMVLPGIQTLFGFQLIAVFQPTFGKSLSEDEQRLHLAATALSAVAAALAIAPASLHRRAQPNRVTKSYMVVATRQLTLAMWPLALAVAIDFGLIARMILMHERTAWVLAAVLFVGYTLLWVVYPRIFAARHDPVEHEVSS